MSVEILDPQLGPNDREFTPATWPQWRFLESPAPELLFSARFGALKSRSLTQKADARCRSHARARVVVARKRRTDLGSTTLKTLLDQTITPSHRAWGWNPSADGGSVLHYPNGSEILCAGLDNPGKLKSGEFDLALIDQCEELDEEEWDSTAGRLRHQPAPILWRDGKTYPAYRQIAGACNPDEPSHFLFRRFHPDRGSHVQRDENGVVLRETILAAATDGFGILPPDYVARLQRFRGKFRDRYVGGLWIAFEGTVYGDVWDPNVHIVQRPASWAKWGGYPPPDWTRYRAIDFGYTNPFVCQWWARDPDSNYWLYREIYHSRRVVPMHRDQIAQLEAAELAAIRARIEQDNAERPPNQRLEVPVWLDIDMSVTDHDSGDRALLEAEGAAMVATTPAVKDVSAGIQTVTELLTPFEIGSITVSRLKFLDNAVVEKDEVLEFEGKPTSTLDEIPRYHFPKKQETGIVEQNRESPFKADDHGCDAMRYLFHTLKTLGTANIYRV